MSVPLYDYFGVLGCLSILIWGTALVLLVLSSRHGARSLYCFLALGLAVGGMMLAKVNSANVSAIELDPYDAMSAAKKVRQASEATGEGDSKPASLRFAEGDPEEPIPAYRKQGKQARLKGKKPDPAAAGGASLEEPERSVKTLREADLLAANRLDRLNLLMVRLIVWWAVGRVVVDYLRRLNSTAGGYWPLPIAGGWLDRCFGKTHAVLVLAPVSDGMTPRAYAERVVKQGESFIYFGESDPWSGQDWLPRLALGRWPVWRFPKLDYGDPALAVNGEFVLDAAWFNRCSVVVTRDEDGAPLFEHMMMLVSQRHEAGSVAHKTVHFIWDLPRIPEPDILAPLVRIARETNIKVTVWASSPVWDEFTELFEECI